MEKTRLSGLETKVGGGTKQRQIQREVEDYQARSVDRATLALLRGDAFVARPRRATLVRSEESQR